MMPTLDINFKSENHGQSHSIERGEATLCCPFMAILGEQTSIYIVLMPTSDINLIMGPYPYLRGGRVCFSSVGFPLEIPVDTAGGKGNSSSGLKDGTPVKKYSKVVTSLSQSIFIFKFQEFNSDNTEKNLV